MNFISFFFLMLVENFKSQPRLVYPATWLSASGWTPPATGHLCPRVAITKCHRLSGLNHGNVSSSSRAQRFETQVWAGWFLLGRKEILPRAPHFALGLLGVFCVL